MTNEYGQDIDAMWEADAAAEWERLNAETAVAQEEVPEEPLTKNEFFPIAGRLLRYAIEELDTVCDDVNEAAETLVDTPMGDRITSVLFELEKLLKELKDLKGKLGEDAA